MLARLTGDNSSFFNQPINVESPAWVDERRHAASIFKFYHVDLVLLCSYLSSSLITM